MLELRTFFDIRALKKEWHSISEGLSVYQTYPIQKKIASCLPMYAIPQKWRPVYVEVLENKKPVLIAPLCKYLHSNRWGIIGHFNGVQSFDFIYAKDISNEKMREYVVFMIKELRIGELEIRNMPETSAVYQAIKETGRFSAIQESENVNIYFGTNYGDYLQNLSKSTRQNIRTAYNRLKTDHLDFRLEYSSRTIIKKTVSDQLIDIYCKRHESRYSVSTSKFKKFYLKNYDFSTRCQRFYKDNVCAILYIDERIAAFLSGLIDENANSAVIPRLSINEEFKRYSPGIVLINEVAKKFTGTEHIGNLDLSKGSENYKLTMGGHIYRSFDFVVKGD